MAGKRTLGRGLGALIPQASTPDVDRADRKLIHVSPGKIRPNPQQPRTAFGGKDFEGLKASIKERGLLQPITVRQVKEGYELIAGERRWRAAIELELKDIPAYLYRIHTKVDLLDLALTENIFRSDLDPIELAMAYQKLINEFQLTQQDIGDRFQVDRATVANLLRLLSLPKDLQDRVQAGRMTQGHARTLLGVKDPEAQTVFADQIETEDPSVRALERLIADGAPPKSRPRKKKSANGAAEAEPWVRDLQDRLRTLVGAKVHIRQQGAKGRIEIEYYSHDDLTRIMDALMSPEAP